MNINSWIGIATLLSATFFLAGYSILLIQAYENDVDYLFISILYFLGALSFFLYGIFVMYRAFKYPVPTWISV